METRRMIGRRTKTTDDANVSEKGYASKREKILKLARTSSKADAYRKRSQEWGVKAKDATTVPTRKSLDHTFRSIARRRQQFDQFVAMENSAFFYAAAIQRAANFNKSAATSQEHSTTTAVATQSIPLHPNEGASIDPKLYTFGNIDVLLQSIALCEASQASTNSFYNFVTTNATSDASYNDWIPRSLSMPESVHVSDVVSTCATAPMSYLAITSNAPSTDTPIPESHHAEVLSSLAVTQTGTIGIMISELDTTCDIREIDREYEEHQGVIIQEESVAANKDQGKERETVAKPGEQAQQQQQSLDNHLNAPNERSSPISDEKQNLLKQCTSTVNTAAVNKKQPQTSEERETDIGTTENFVLPATTSRDCTAAAAPVAPTEMTFIDNEETTIPQYSISNATRGTQGTAIKIDNRVSLDERARQAKEWLLEHADINRRERSEFKCGPTLLDISNMPPFAQETSKVNKIFVTSRHEKEVPLDRASTFAEEIAHSTLTSVIRNLAYNGQLLPKMQRSNYLFQQLQYNADDCNLIFVNNKRMFKLLITQAPYFFGQHWRTGQCNTNIIFLDEGSSSGDEGSGPNQTCPAAWAKYVRNASSIPETSSRTDHGIEACLLMDALSGAYEGDHVTNALRDIRAGVTKDLARLKLVADDLPKRLQMKRNLLGDKMSAIFAVWKSALNKIPQIVTLDPTAMPQSTKRFRTMFLSWSLTSWLRHEVFKSKSDNELSTLEKDFYMGYVSESRLEFGTPLSTDALRCEPTLSMQLFLLRAGAPRLWIIINEMCTKRLVDVVEKECRTAERKFEFADCGHAFAVPRGFILLDPIFLHNHQISFTVQIQMPGELLFMRENTIYQFANLGSNVVEAVCAKSMAFDKIALPIACKCPLAEYAQNFRINNQMAYKLKCGKARRFHCSICKTDYATSTALRTHYDAKHASRCNYPCGQCQLRFTLPEIRDLHYRSHLATEFFCLFCNTHQKSRLYRHMNYRHQIDEKIFHYIDACGNDYQSRAYRIYNSLTPQQQRNERELSKAITQLAAELTTEVQKDFLDWTELEGIESTDELLEDDSVVLPKELSIERAKLKRAQRADKRQWQKASCSRETNEEPQQQQQLQREEDGDAATTSRLGSSPAKKSKSSSVRVQCDVCDRSIDKNNYESHRKKCKGSQCTFCSKKFVCNSTRLRHERSSCKAK